MAAVPWLPAQWPWEAAGTFLEHAVQLTPGLATAPPHRSPVPPALYRSPLDIERSGVPPPPKLDSYLNARVDKMYAQLSVSVESSEQWSVT